ncbi:MAG TPA: ribonuclease P protein component [Syntrophomonas sp.]|jgi:ribonuclease P protein component|nr:ribonuclease P protein component [Syntrophomonas sp.]
MLAKSQRIKQGRDFHNIYKSGHRVSGRYILLFFRPGAGESSRVGFVVSKKVGKAVIRNRAKRRLRALWREIMPGLKQPFDVVINARPSIKESSCEELHKDLLFTLKKAKLC